MDIAVANNLLIDNWISLKEKVKNDADITNIQYNTWIAPLDFHYFDGKNVLISIPEGKNLPIEYLEKNYQAFFKVQVCELLNSDDDIEISFLKPEDIQNFPSSNNNISLADDNNNNVIQSNNPNPDISDYFTINHINQKFSFNTFVVGKNNNFAFNACLAVAESPGKAYNPLFLYGGPGLGKTHLMHAIAAFVMNKSKDSKILYVTSEKFTNDVIESIRSGRPETMSRLRDKYRTVDILLVDDVQFIIGKESTQEEFFHTFNELHQAGKQIVISSDKPPKEMETLEDRFRSRFEMGLIADIQAPDYETRMAILQNNYDALDHKCFKEEDTEKILDYIVSNIESNIRELEGAFTKVIAFSRLNNIDEISFDDAKDALKDIVFPNKNRVITPAIILETVCEHYNIKKEDILSKKRSQEIVFPRHIIMFLCRELTDLSLVDIGRAIGGKDHSTVLSSVDKIEGLLKVDDELKNNVDLIRKKLNVN